MSFKNYVFVQLHESQQPQKKEIQKLLTQQEIAKTSIKTRVLRQTTAIIEI